MSPSPAEVVICDDVPAMRILVRHMLAGDEWSVVGEAGDGAAAVELVQRTHPDAIVLDLSMPGMDGLEAMPQLREAVPELAIVAFSALPEGRMRPAAEEAGADRYLQKGVRADALCDALREAIAARRGDGV